MKSRARLVACAAAGFQWGIFVPIALLALVGTLASLQYKWLGQVGEAERDESAERRSSGARADFSDEFDREITRAYTTFRPRADQADAATAEALSARADGLARERCVPELVKRVFVYRQTSQGSELSVLTADGYASRSRRLDRRAGAPYARAWPTRSSGCRPSTTCGRRS
jgi:hypothetical protein